MTQQDLPFPSFDAGIEPEPEQHSHPPLFASGESLIGARACNRCGAYVSGLRLEAHQEFHDLIDRLGTPVEAVLVSDPAPAKRDKARKKGRRK